MKILIHYPNKNDEKEETRIMHNYMRLLTQSNINNIKLKDLACKNCNFKNSELEIFFAAFLSHEPTFQT